MTHRYQSLTFRQTGDLLRALGGGTAGFDYKRCALSDLRRFIGAWIAQGSFTLEHVESLAAAVSAPAVPPAPVAAPVPVPVPPAPIPAAPAPVPVAPAPAPVLPPAPVPVPPAPPVIVPLAPPPADPAVPAPFVPVGSAPWPCGVPAPVLPPGTVPAAPAAPVSVRAGTSAPYRTVPVRALFADQAEIAAALPEHMTVRVYDDPDAPAIDTIYRFNAALLLKTLIAMGCAHPMPTWLGGPKGTGKTEFARQVAARLGRAFFRVGFSRATEPSEILGDMGLVDGRTQWVDGPVTQALRTPGAVLLLDEITYAAQGYLASLNPVLECGGAPVRLPRTGEALIPAEDVMVFAADNTLGHGDTSGEYTARQPLSADTLDRFRFKLRFDYLPEDQERAVLLAHVARECGRRLRAGAATAIIKLMHVARDKGAAGELQGAPGLRAAVAMAVLLSGGVPAPEAFDDAITRSAPPESHETLRAIFAAHWPANDPDVAAAFA